MGAKTFVLHDNSLNVQGFRMLTEGADLSAFKKNPVMLLNHDDWSLPIGRWENIHVDGDRILADAVFDMEDARAKDVSGKVDRGFLKAVSIAGRVISLSDDASVKLPGQKEPTVTKWLVREASLCSVGANHKSLVLYDREDKIIDLSQPHVLLSLIDSPGVVMLNQNNFKMNYLKRLFKLSDGASEDAISEAAESVLDENRRLKAEKTTLEDEINQLKARVSKSELAVSSRLETDAVSLVDAAIREARINADGRQAWLDDFKTNFVNAHARLSSIPARQSVSSQIQTGSESEFVKLTWDEMDRKGKLEQLKTSDPALYKLKYKERFGVEPNV